MDIEGLSEKTAGRLLDELDIRDLPEIYELKYEELIELEGFKEKKSNNLLEAIEESKQVELASFIYALGIDSVGIKTASDLANHFQSLESLRGANVKELLEIGDIGPIIAENIIEFFNDEEIIKAVDKLLAEGVEPYYEGIELSNSIFTDKTVVITGRLDGYTRKEAKELVEAMGGRVTGSVSGNTDYLIAGESAGSKYDRAVELGISIIDGEKFNEIGGRK